MFCLYFAKGSPPLKTVGDIFRAKLDRLTLRPLSKRDFILSILVIQVLPYFLPVDCVLNRGLHADGRPDSRSTFTLLCLVCILEG